MILEAVANAIDANANRIDISFEKDDSLLMNDSLTVVVNLEIQT